MKKIYVVNKNKAGVSAVIGVILMVAITVAIAGVVYVYIQSMMNDEAYKYNDVQSGEIDYIYQRGLDDKTIIIINGRSLSLDNDLSFFDGIEKGDYVTLYLRGNNFNDWVCDHWEYV